MRPLVFGLSFVVTLLGLAPAYASVSQTSASGSIGGEEVEVDGHSDPVAAEPTTLSKEDGSGDSYKADAHADKTFLKVSAEAHRAGSFESLSASSRATASWTDELTVANPDLLAGRPDDPSELALFQPAASGSGSGDVEADFYVTIYDPVHPEIGDSVSTSTFSKAAVLKAPVPLFILKTGTTYQMSLTVYATAHDVGQNSTINYMHTGYLPPIYIGRADGTPIPELAGLQLVGASGRQYAVTVVQKTPGDYNGNGIVDAADYTVWRDSIGNTGFAPAPDADGNGDGVVDNDDYGVWLTNFGTVADFGGGSGGGGAAGVPEPGAAMLLFAAGLVGAVGRSYSRICDRAGKRKSLGKRGSTRRASGSAIHPTSPIGTTCKSPLTT
jgi:hypothetical protein